MQSMMKILKVSENLECCSETPERGTFSSALCVVQINCVSGVPHKNKYLKAFLLGKCFPKWELSSVCISM